MLRSLVVGLGRANHLALGLQALGKGHVAYGVEPRHYGVFKHALLETVEEILGPSRYRPDVAEAWRTVIDNFVSLMTRGVGQERLIMSPPFADRPPRGVGLPAGDGIRPSIGVELGQKEAGALAAVG